MCIQKTLKWKKKNVKTFVHDDYQGDVNRVNDLDANIFCWEFAFTIFFNVRICLLSVKATIVFDVLKGLGRQPSTAAKVIEGSGTIHKLLLRERDCLSKCLGIGCLKSPSGAAIHKYWRLELRSRVIGIFCEPYLSTSYIRIYLNVQQDPQWPWSLIGLTMPSTLQSFCTYR